MKGDETSVDETAFMVFCNMDKNYDDSLSEEEFINGVMQNPKALAILTT